MFILNLVDFYGGSFIVYILGIAQICAVSWIYGKLKHQTVIFRNIHILFFKNKDIFQ